MVIGKRTNYAKDSEIMWKSALPTLPLAALWPLAAEKLLQFDAAATAATAVARRMNEMKLFIYAEN